MNISKSFIDRPIFASVLSAVIFIAGLIAIPMLPISEYPDVTPPTVEVSAQYPGANPRVISEVVATPLEEAINGVENMLYMSSQATTDGRLKITVTFKIGTNPDLAQQQIQNRITQALPRLPEEVRQLGVMTFKSSPSLTMVVHLFSPDETYDVLYLRNYAVLNVKDSLSRIKGMGQVAVFGAGDYAMRLWLNPDKIAERKLTAMDVVHAVRSQNLQVAAGVVGNAPTTNPVDVVLPVNAQGRLTSPEEFGEIIVSTGTRGEVTRLKDVARIEIAAADYGLRSLLNNKQAVAIPVFQAPNSNAIQISDDVRATMEELKKTFPPGIDYDIVYDPTVFVRDSISAVVTTLLEAVLLVVLVVVVFLQTWRASIIPLIAVPVSIIGTFAVLHLLGLSINALSLFGLVLAIGIVVDDAIVVVENVERNIHRGLSPREATYAAMEEVSEPIIAIALTLCAVFIPIAFISGLTGAFYQQFALTIAISTVISAFNSLTLSPALAAVLLKGKDAPKDWLTRVMDTLFGRFFNWFNHMFERRSEAYATSVNSSLNRKGLWIFIYLILIGFTYVGFKVVPPGFIPLQDKQYLIGFVQLPDGASLDRTEKVIREMSDIALKEPGVRDAIAFPGLSINGFVKSPGGGIVFIGLNDFSERKEPQLYGPAIAGSLMQKFGAIDDAFVAVFPPPPVMGLGETGGFKLQVEDRADMGYEALYNAVNQVIGKAYQTPGLAAIYTGYKINTPQLYAKLDRTKAMQMGLSVADVFNTMQIYLGSLYVNDFNKFGRTYQVIAQADSQYRDHADDIARLQVRNNRGEMIPLGAVLKVEETYGPEMTMRYNAYRSADINASPAPGFSSGQAQQIMAQLLNETLPPGMTFEWTDLTYQQILAGNTALLVFPLCVLLVFLVLAAQYESLILPLAIILIVPMSIMAAIFGVWLTGGDNNIFTQISLFVLAGLACKNAILIVEFARELEHKGLGIVEAAIQASRLRLRPILMTSFAFIMGVVPLVTSTGAGAEMRHAMGVAVFSGMIGVTFFGLFLTPIFYVALRKLAGRNTNEEA